MSSIWAASALPKPTESPWPSEPVATSTQGILGVGWPSRLLSSWRRVRTSFSSMMPASAYAAHNSGAACPFDKTKRSFAGFRGSLGSKRISLKKMTETRSAADKQDEGWPEPASVVAFRERILSLLPFSFNLSMIVGISFILYRRLPSLLSPRDYGVHRRLRLQSRSTHRAAWASLYPACRYRRHRPASTLRID